MMNDDHSGFVSVLSSSARRRHRLRRSVSSTGECCNANGEIISLQNRLGFLEWFIFNQMPYVNVQYQHAEHRDIEPVLSDEASKSPLLSEDHQKLEDEESIPRSQEINAITETLDKLTAELRGMLYLSDPVCRPENMSDTQEEGFKRSLHISDTNTSAPDHPLEHDGPIYDELRHFSTVAAEKSWRESGNEILRCDAPLLHRLGEILRKLSEAGSETQQKISLQDEYEQLVDAHHDKHPGGKLPTQLRSIEAFKMFKSGIPGWQCRP